MAEYGGARLTKVGEKVNTNMVLIFTDRKMSTLGKTVKNHQVLLSNSFVSTEIFPPGSRQSEKSSRGAVGLTDRGGKLNLTSSDPLIFFS